MVYSFYVANHHTDMNIYPAAAAALIAAGADATDTMIERVVFTATVHIRCGDSLEAAIAEGVATHLLPS